MQEIRRARLESAIQQELSLVIPREVKDPRVCSITITRVSVSPDAGMATVFFTILGSGEDEASARKMLECLSGLRKASGFLRRFLGKALQIRTIPHLNFKEDRGVGNVSKVHELLKQIDDEKSKRGPAD